MKTCSLIRKKKKCNVPRFLTLQDPNDPDSKVPLEKLKKVYYHARGWNAEGLPTDRTLKKLKLDEISIETGR